MIKVSVIGEAVFSWTAGLDRRHEEKKTGSLHRRIWVGADPEFVSYSKSSATSGHGCDLLVRKLMKKERALICLRDWRHERALSSSYCRRPGAECGQACRSKIGNRATVFLLFLEVDALDLLILSFQNRLLHP